MRTHSLRSLNIFEGVRWYPSSGSLMPGRVAQSVGHLTRKSQGLGSIPGLATYFRFFFRSRGAVVSYWRKYVHKVLVNHSEGLSLPRKSVVRLTDRPDMTLDVYRGRKTTCNSTTTGSLSQSGPSVGHLDQQTISAYFSQMIWWLWAHP